MLVECPNCNKEMRHYVRSGVELDICTLCQGVWLDKNELKRLLKKSHKNDNQEFEDLEFKSLPGVDEKYVVASYRSRSANKKSTKPGGLMGILEGILDALD